MPLHAVGRLQLSPALTSTAQHAFALDDLKTGTLFSLSQFCDDDCIVLFTKYGVKIIKEDKVIITSGQDDNGLWAFPLASAPLTLQASVILKINKTKSKLAAYHHAPLSSHSTSTHI